MTTRMKIRLTKAEALVDFTTDTPLEGEALKIAEVIFDLAAVPNHSNPDLEPTLYTGGGAPFCMPKTWANRGELYGLTSKLIIIHDGGELSHYCCMDYDTPEYYFTERLREALEEAGYRYEPCTRWYTAVYKND